MPIGRDAVIWTCRLLLGREPESEEVVALHARHPQIESYVDATIQCAEFRARHGNKMNLSRSWVWAEIDDDVILRVNLSDLYVSWQAIEGVFERRELEFVRKTVKPSWIVLDIGANLGFFSIVMGSLIGPTGHLHPFEPMPELYDSLVKSLARNGFASRSTSHNAAVSNTGGEATIMYAPNAHNWGGSTIVDPARNVPAGHRTAKAPILKIDDALSLDRLDFIKIDVEGHELSALRGAEATLRRFRPLILSEIAPDLLSAAGVAARTYFDFVTGLVYGCRRLGNAGDLGKLVGPDDLDSIINVVFTPEGVAQ